MLFSHALIRRYTPPTCTLEIWAKRSPLSRWTDRPILKSLRFELRFDDPRTPENEQITVRGDGKELEFLCDVVTNYVQNFLNPNPNYFSVNFGLNPQSQLETESSRNTVVAQLEPIKNEADNLSLNSLSPDNLGILNVAPSLKSQGFLTHELSFGSLVTEPLQPVLQLSSSQLFDLANALEEYSNEAVILPNFGHSSPRKINIFWTSSAAAFLLAMGITVGAKIFYTSQSGIGNIAARKAAESQNDRSPLIDVLPPVPPAPLGKPVPAPTLPSTLAKQGILPPPSGVQSGIPPVRNAQGVVIVPPTPILPPRPVVPPAPPKTIAIVPQYSNNLPAPNLFTIPSSQQTNKVSPSNTIPSLNLPPLPPLNSQSSIRENSERRFSDFSSARVSPPSDTPPISTPKPTNNLLDTIPQVAETRDYFQKRWQVPQGLTQALEYRLIVQQDGSLKRIIPLGKAASIYLDRTPMPLLGEAFVSPLQISGEQTLRLVLEPKGNVRTYLE